MKKRYVRYRLVAESSIIKRGRTQLVDIREDDTRVWNKPGMKDKTAYQLLGEAVKVIAKAGADTTWLVYTAMKRMGGTIITLIKDFIKKLPGIAVSIFNFVRRLVEIFWNTFGKGFLNLLKGLAAICSAFFGSLSDAFGKAAGNPNGTQGDTKTLGGTDATSDKTGASQGSSNGASEGKYKNNFKKYLDIVKYPLSAFGSSVGNPTGDKTGKPQNNNYVPNFILSDRAIRILNEAANNPAMVSKTLDNYIEKAKPKFKNLCYRCVKSNVVETNPQLAKMIGASTILVCGYSGSSGQFANLQNNTGAKTKQ